MLVIAHTGVHAMPRGMTDIDRVMALIEKRPDGHWIWKGAKCGNKKEYGQVRFRGKKPVAHKVVWILLRGEVPEGYEMLHQCPFTLCCNPDHLRTGTHLENMKEAREAGSFMKMPSGESHWNNKLSNRSVEKIRKRILNGEKQADLAKEFHVTQPYISMIIHKKYR